MNLLLDFDGTLVDISDKYWWVYSQFVQRHGAKFEERDLFWRMKRDGQSDEKILALAGLKPELAVPLKAHIRQTIETGPALELDRLIPGVSEFLARMARDHRLVLISARKSRAGLVRQVEKLGLRPLFSEILTVDESGSTALPGRTPKSIVLTESRWLAGPALIVGDAAMDVQTGKALGITSCAVLSGIRTRRFLEELQPDYIIDSILDLESLLSRL